jgi:hypothetical protein
MTHSTYFHCLMRMLLLTLAAVVPDFAAAQVVTVSDEIPMTRDANYDLLGFYDGRFLLSRQTAHEVTLLAFDQKMSQISEKSLALDLKKPAIIAVIPAKNTVDVYFVNPQKDRISLHLRRFDGMGTLKDSLLIKEIPWIGILPEYKVTMSDNREKAVVHGMDREDNLQVYFIDLNTTTLIADHVYSLNQMDFRSRFRKILLSNQSDLLILLDNAESSGRKEDYEVSVLVSSPDVAMPRLYPSRIGPANFYSPAFKLDETNRRVVFVSPFAGKNISECLGIAYSAFDLVSNTWQNVQLVTFDPELLEAKRSGRRSRAEGISDLYLDNLILREDGGALVFLEERREFERSLYQGRRDFYGMRFAIDYYYDDIYAIAIRPDGQNHWQKRFPKKQYSFDDDALYSSFFLFASPSSLRVIYNDEIKNENTVSEYILTGGGISERRNVLNTNRQDLRLQVRYSLQVSSNEFIIPSVRRNRLKMVKVSYSE